MFYIDLFCYKQGYHGLYWFWKCYVKKGQKKIKPNQSAGVWVGWEGSCEMALWGCQLFPGEVWFCQHSATGGLIPWGHSDPGSVRLWDELCPSVLQLLHLSPCGGALSHQRGTESWWAKLPSWLPQCSWLSLLYSPLSVWAHSGQLPLPTSCWRSFVFLHWLLLRDFWNCKLTQIITVGMWI